MSNDERSPAATETFPQAGGSGGDRQPPVTGVDDDPGPGKHAKSGGSFFRELPFLVVIAFLLALLIKAFLIQAFYIPSGSMQQTLELRDRVLVNKLVYDFREIHRGEIVVFNGLDSFTPETEIAEPTNGVQRVLRAISSAVGVGAPGEKDFIKRVIGVPGDTVEVRDDAVFINGARLEEDYILATPNYTYGPKTVPEGQYFVLGDNRRNSFDSHQWANSCPEQQQCDFVPEENIIGQAWLRYWPFEDLGFVNNKIIKPLAP